MRHINHYALMMLALAGIATAAAQPLTPEEALGRITNSDPGRRAAAAGSYQLKYTLDDGQRQPALYVFGKEGGAGFIIASAEGEASPLLGYSDEGTFDPAGIPANLRYWLGQYAGEIEQLREGKISRVRKAAESTSEQWEAIAPLVKSKWNQGAPYNKYCFELSSTGEETQSVTGCVATAMAQVMYYYKYPTVGKGSISYKHGDSGTYEMNFGEQAFDWSAMLPTYLPDSYTEAEGEAVAYLMKACGYSVKMDYSKGDAGANGAEIGNALIEYFGYDDNIEVQTRAYYTYSEWQTMIYDNLKNVGPLVYDGSALDGGHSFVCDGYDGNGYFHINWGWGGMSDGYYLLDALNPDEFGIGGAAGGYNLGQQVILNISPDASQPITPQLMQFGNLSGNVADGKLTLKLDDTDRPGFQYINPAPLTLTFGVEVVNETDPSQANQYVESEKKNLEAKQGSFYTWEDAGTDVDLAALDLQEGDEYRFIVVTYITRGSDSEWTEVVAMPGKANYVTVTKTASGYEVAGATPGNLSVSDFKVVSSPVYWNLPIEFSATFTNASSTALTRNYSAVLFDSDGKECYKMENYSINVDADSSVSDDWTSIVWYKEDGAGDVTEATTYTVKLYDNWQGEYVDGVETTVTVEPSPANAKVESELRILNGTKEGDVYEIQGDELSVALTVKVTEGVFNHTLMLALQQPMKDGDYLTIMHKHFDAIPNLTAGEEETYEMSVTLDDIDPDTTYRVEVWGPDGGFNETALVKFVQEQNGVGTIAADADGNYSVYTIAGTLIGVYSGLDLIPDLPHGIYIVNGKKVMK